MNGITVNQVGAVRTAPVGRRLWLFWVLAGLVGWGVGGPLGVALGTPGYIIENGFMSISFGGILAGVLQWLALRNRLVPAGWWVPASIVGAVVFGIVVFGGLAVNIAVVTDVTWMVGACLFPLVAGFLQWRLVLRRQIAGGAGWWVPTGLVGFFAGGILASLPAAALGMNGKEGGLDAVVVWTLIGAVYGALTGAVLVKLLRRRV